MYVPIVTPLTLKCTLHDDDLIPPLPVSWWMRNSFLELKGTGLKTKSHAVHQHGGKVALGIKSEAADLGILSD